MRTGRTVAEHNARRRRDRITVAYGEAIAAAFAARRDLHAGSVELARRFNPERRTST